MKMDSFSHRMHPSTALRRRYALDAVRAGLEAEGVRQLCEFAIQRWKGKREELLTANSHTHPSRPPRLYRIISVSMVVFAHPGCDIQTSTITSSTSQKQ